MTTTDAKLETLNKDLGHLSRMVNDLPTDDYETVRAMSLLIQSMKADVEDIRLELAPDEEFAEAA